MKVRVGVIGVGRMGTYHLEKLLGLFNVQVVGFLDTNPERCRAIQEKYQVRLFTSLDEFLFEADAVVVATPTATHAFIVNQALQRGVHVLVEKPVAEELSEVEVLIRLARARKLVFQVGFVERFRYRALAPILEGTPIRFFESTRLASKPGREPSVDVVFDLMIHDLDLVMNLVKEMPTVVSAIGVAVLTPYIDLANVRLEFPSGAVANLNASRVAPFLKSSRKVRLYTSQSYASLDFMENKVSLYSKDRDNQISHRLIANEAVDALKDQCVHFIECIQEGKIPWIKGEDGLASLQVAKEISQKISARAQQFEKGRPCFSGELFS